MRTNKFFKTGLLLFVASLGLISCGDDDKEPEIVIDPVSENVEYYIEGKVVADKCRTGRSQRYSRRGYRNHRRKRSIFTDGKR
ncbi:hypothetical protein [Phocaeicola vulgatus]|uniref:hypothetical protein n=1 Tax=Phocaeicola vulgatus TaxID=821 RepID=UPI001BEEB82E|nr:hypothetical protein [Phocaeicola vulgatus]QUT58570.1 hypothetical protein INE85_02632 [Phocaeicola vulgatus]